MNKYQKRKSRQIKDIMRADVRGRTSYKEAKREWRKGTRALPVINFGTNHYGLPTAMLNEILEFCTERNLKFSCYLERLTGEYILQFRGQTPYGGRYGIERRFSIVERNRYRGSLADFTRMILREVNHRLRDFIFPKVNVHEWEPTDVEAVFGKLIEKEVTTNA